MNNKLYSIKKLGFSIDWTLIEIGLYGKAFIKPQITKSEVIQYCYTLLEHKTTYEKTVVELICEKDNDANFKKLVSKLISYDKTVDIDICLRKWRAFILWNLLSHLTSDYMQNLLEINEFWAEMGFPENVDHIYPSSKNISIYFTSVNCNRIIKKNTHWLHNDIAQIMKLQ